MSKQTLSYLVLGAGLGVFLLKLTQQQTEDAAEAVEAPDGCEVVSLAKWKAARGLDNIVADAG